jgi:hypothetical protein
MEWTVADGIPSLYHLQPGRPASGYRFKQMTPPAWTQGRVNPPRHQHYMSIALSGGSGFTRASISPVQSLPDIAINVNHAAPRNGSTLPFPLGGVSMNRAQSAIRLRRLSNRSLR